MQIKKTNNIYYAKYHITIIDPKEARDDPNNKNFVNHKVDYIVGGKPVRMKPAERIKYDAFRQRQKFSELDFIVNRQKSTQLIFTISQNSRWIFREENPIIINPTLFNGTQLPAGIWVSEKEAYLDVPGVTIDVLCGEEFKYTLHYLDENNKDETQDPIVRNGSELP